MQIFIVDDHPLVVDAYLRCLSQDLIFSEPPKFTIAQNCKEGFEIINELSDEPFFDLAIIDQSLPKYEKKNILCGSHLALMLQKKHPKCKIIMITGHSEIITIYDLVKTVAPHGLIVKGDVTFENLRTAVLQIVEGSKFYSSTVERIIQNIWKKDLLVDDVNREILMHLYKGYKIQELEKIVSLSVSAIKRRIAQMKEVFEVSEESSLVKEAIRQGFI